MGVDPEPPVGVPEPPVGVPVGSVPPDPPVGVGVSPPEPEPPVGEGADGQEFWGSVLSCVALVMRERMDEM